METKRVFACKTGDVAAGQQKIVTIGKLPVGIFQIGSAYHALLNVCPHRGAALCEGPQCGTTMATDGYAFHYGKDEHVVRCAWHGWEFDIPSGAFLVDPSIKARRFDVTVDGEDIYVHL